MKTTAMTLLNQSSKYFYFIVKATLILILCKPAPMQK